MCIGCPVWTRLKPTCMQRVCGWIVFFGMAGFAITSSLPYTDPDHTVLWQLSQQLLGVRSGRYFYMDTLQHLDHSPLPQHPQSSNLWPPLTCPIVVATLAWHLRTHLDVNFVLWGLTEGFHISYPSVAGLHSSAHNHPSSLANEHVVSEYIGTEVAAGQMVGPMLPQLFSTVHCSPVGYVPKGKGMGHWRMIVGLSCPHGRSINDGIHPNLASLQYSLVDNAVHFIYMLGCDTLLIKIDLRNAFRFVPVHPQDWYLTIWYPLE